MKYLVLTMLAVLPFGACAGADVPKTEVTINQELPKEVQKVLRRSVENLVFVEGGGFQMGDVGAYITSKSFNEGPLGSYEFVDKNHPDAMWMPWVFQAAGEKRTAEPVHKVTLSSYSMGKYEVTFEEFDVYTQFTEKPLLVERKLGKRSRKPAKPVRYMTWQQARDYCLWLGENTGLNIDLPTEAQWEYAARSRGKKVAYGTDTGMPKKGTNIGSGLGVEKVGSYPPNPLGFYDMSANVKEWILDWFDPDYYANSPEVDPQGPESGTEKSVRGGKVVLQRYHEPPKAAPRITKEFGYEGHPYVGFRCVVNEDKPIILK